MQDLIGVTQTMAKTTKQEVILLLTLLQTRKWTLTNNLVLQLPLRRPNTWPKVLSCGRSRGKFPSANWTSVTKGCGCRLNSGCDIPQAPPLLNNNNQEPTVERNLTVVAPTDRVQTDEGNLAPSKSKKDLANWSWVRLGNTRARLTNNNRAEQRQRQRCNDNTDDRTLDETGDHAD